MRLLLRRRANGIGDWLFMLWAIKHINVQRPDVVVFVDFETTAQPTLPFIREAFQASDVRYVPWTGRGHGLIDAALEHVVYPRTRVDVDRNPPYIEGVLEQLGGVVGRELRFDPELVPTFSFVRFALDSMNYVAIAPASKHRAKDWGWPRFEHLATELENARPDLDVVQLAGPGEPWLRGASAILQARSFSSVCGAIAGAKSVVCTENGIAVLAGFLGAPQVTIYRQPRTAERMTFRRQAKLQDPTVDQVRAAVLEHLRAE